MVSYIQSLFRLSTHFIFIHFDFKFIYWHALPWKRKVCLQLVLPSLRRSRPSLRLLYFFPPQVPYPPPPPTPPLVSRSQTTFIDTKLPARCSRTWCILITAFSTTRAPVFYSLSSVHTCLARWVVVQVHLFLSSHVFRTITDNLNLQALASLHSLFAPSTFLVLCTHYLLVGCQ